MRNVSRRPMVAMETERCVREGKGLLFASRGRLEQFLGAYCCSGIPIFILYALKIMSTWPVPGMHYPIKTRVRRRSPNFTTNFPFKKITCKTIVQLLGIRLPIVCATIDGKHLLLSR